MLSQKQKSIKNTIVYLFFMLLTIIAAVISDNTHYLKLTAVFMIIAAYYIYRLIRKKDSTEKPKDKLKKQLKKTEIGKKTLEKIEENSAKKKISEKKREMLYEQITNEAISYGIGIINQKEIDEINILQATKKGLTEAIKDMENKLAEKPELGIIKPDAILVDALTKIDTDGIPYKSIIHGDAISYSIACASIIAKVTRDRIMRQWDEIYSQYGFAKHKGYGTAAHIKALKEYGPCPLHRASFIKNFI